MDLILIIACKLLPKWTTGQISIKFKAFGSYQIWFFEIAYFSYTKPLCTSKPNIAKKAEDIELVTFKSDILDIGFEIVALSEFYKKIDKNRQKSHIVNVYVILFITDGSGKHEINFKTYAYQKTTLFLLIKDSNIVGLNAKIRKDLSFCLLKNFYKKIKLPLKIYLIPILIIRICIKPNKDSHP